MSDNKLVLYPRNPFASVANPTAFVQALLETGFLGESFDWWGENHYKPGSNFYQQILFSAEHTTVILGPTEKGLEELNRVPNQTTCHLSITPSTAEPEVITSGYLQAPNCANCGHLSTVSILSDWYRDKTNYRWACPACGKQSTIYDLNWHGGTGFARFAIDIWNIHLSEAIPSEDFMTTLKNLSGETWTYLYYRL